MAKKKKEYEEKEPESESQADLTSEMIQEDKPESKEVPKSESDLKEHPKFHKFKEGK